ncbi:MAG TPA: hypothetical protein VE994_04155, partial [Terriglobales bacterium]|nr:hypothetical protein [Terriglobales bacterium]
TSDATYGTPSHALQLILTIDEFRILVPMISQTIRAGGTAQYELDYTPPNQTVPGSVTFSCGALPPLARCSFAPNPIPANTPATVMLSIATTAPVASLAPAAFDGSILYACLYVLPLGGLLYAGRARVRSRKRGILRASLFLPIVLGLMLFVQCGGGGNKGGGGGPYVSPSQSGTPVGTYTVNVTARAGAASKTFALTLTVQ